MMQIFEFLETSLFPIYDLLGKMFILPLDYVVCGLICICTIYIRRVKVINYVSGIIYLLTDFYTCFMRIPRNMYLNLQLYL